MYCQNCRNVIADGELHFGIIPRLAAQNLLSDYPDKHGEERQQQGRSDVHYKNMLRELIER